MDEKQLYPLSFCTLADEYGWGTDEFLLADLGYRDSIIREGWLAGNTMSEIMDTYLDRVVGENVFAFWGRQFPVQVKHIRVRGTMPLRVHPDAGTAVQRYDFLGRQKLWYVVSAAPGSRILAGWKRDIDAAELCARTDEGNLEEILRTFEPSAGEFIHIPPGTPHAASGDIDIVEVSESSPLDFCLSGLGQEVHPDEFDPALDLTDALDFIDYKEFKGSLQRASDGVMLQLEEFGVSMMKLDSPRKVFSSAGDSFAIYVALSGKASVCFDVHERTASWDVSGCRSLLVPAECPDYAVVPETKDAVLLEITVPHKSVKDSYTGQEIEESGIAAS